MAHVILVSAQGPNPSFFFFGVLLFDLGACLDKGLDSDLDQGLTNVYSWTMAAWLEENELFTVEDDDD